MWLFASLHSHVGAAAETMHDELVRQLKAPGRMFIPVSDRAGQGIYVVDKDKNGRVTKSRTMDVCVSEKRQRIPQALLF